MPKNAEEFECIDCDFRCSKQSNYNAHLLTAKHKNRTNRTVDRTKNAKKCQNRYVCPCGKEYSARNSLWYHKKTCETAKNSPKNAKNSPATVVAVENDVESEKEETVETTLADAMKLFSETMAESNKMVAETQKSVIEMQTKMIETGAGAKTINNIGYMNNNFNINVFLNDNCKDAVNLVDFVDNIQVQNSHLEHIGRNGYVEGISRMLIDNLSELDVTQRPIHCTDTKRMSLYIKNNDKWHKNNTDNQEIHKAIKKVGIKNITQLNTYREEHPEHNNNEFGNNRELYLKICSEVMRVADDCSHKLDEKIIRNMSKICGLDRETMLHIADEKKDEGNKK